MNEFPNAFQRLLQASGRFGVHHENGYRSMQRQGSFQLFQRNRFIVVRFDQLDLRIS